MINAYKILVGKPEGKRSLRRPRCRWEGNNTMHLRDIGGNEWTGFNWLRTGNCGGFL
jgi:hypothetical protein